MSIIMDMYRHLLKDIRDLLCGEKGVWPRDYNFIKIIASNELCGTEHPCCSSSIHLDQLTATPGGLSLSSLLVTLP